ncbi:MAG: Ig-like domain-containing protein, partial [Clostridiales bacterium]|nr:Ig-like domain-containing protein [Clostridiales bacterium]
MKRTMKSLLVILISWIVVSSFTSFKEVSAATSINYNSKVSAFTSNSKWKDGVTWSEKQEPRSEPLSSNWPSQGCLAYACDFVKEVFGHSSYKANATYFTDVSKIQAGDVIHYSNHYFVVLSRSGNKLKTAEGSYALKTGGRKQVSISSSRYSIVSKNGKYYLYKSDTKTYCTSNFYGYHHQTLATSVTLNKSTASLNAGSTVKLSAAVLPKAASASVTWKSSDTSIATVSSSGVVKGIKAGTVTITCKTNDTSDKSVTCKVTVKSAAKVKVTGVSLNKTSLPVIKGYTAQLTAKISPDSATNKSVTWSSSNTK